MSGLPSGEDGSIRIERIPVGIHVTLEVEAHHVELHEIRQHFDIAEVAEETVTLRVTGAGTTIFRLHPAGAPSDPLFGNLGYPRGGDAYSVDVATFSLGRQLSQALNFNYGSGATQRFVVDLDPAGPKAVTALPGGAVWRLEDPHFADQAEEWRRNQVHAVPFVLDDVIAKAEARTVVRPL